MYVKYVKKRQATKKMIESPTRRMKERGTNGGEMKRKERKVAKRKGKGRKREKEREREERRGERGAGGGEAEMSRCSVR